MNSGAMEEPVGEGQILTGPQSDWDAVHGLVALIQAEKERGPQFLRLANALSALYPRRSEERRLLDTMLVAT